MLAFRDNMGINTDNSIALSNVINDQMLMPPPDRRGPTKDTRQ